MTARWTIRATLMAGLLACAPACNSDEPAIESELPDEFPDADAHGVYARGGIELSSVTVDQGVAITVFDEGVHIPVAERASELVAGRPMLLRGFWTVPDDWEARTILARLVLHYPDGSEQVATRDLSIEQDSVPEWFDGTFSFYVPAELVQPKMSFDLTLYEVELVPDDALPPAVVPRLPAEGAAALDPDPSPREMEVVIVPIDHQYDGGKTCPDVPPSFDAERLQGFEDALYAQNPVQAVRVSAREEPLVWTESAADLGKILDALGDLRIEDDASPWVYYYGAIEPCDWGSTDGYAGLAFLPRETIKSEAWRRVAVGDLAVSESASIGTFVHEVGHNQQRRHVPCGDPKGAVVDYPFRNGQTGSFGFDLLSWALYRPTAHDYMSYCGPAWVSHYGWNQVLPVLAELTSWQLQGASTPAPGPGFLVGAVYGDGTTRWFTRPGTPTLDPTSTATLEYWRDDALVGTAPLSVEPRPDGTWEMIAPLPEQGLDAVSHLRPIGAPVTDAVPRRQVHTPKARVTR